MLPLLFATQHFPPLGDVSTQRMLGFVRYLPRLGILPAVLAPRAYWEPFQDPSLNAKIPPFLPLYRIRFPEARQLTGKKKGYGTHSAKLSPAQKLHRQIVFPDSKLFFPLCALPSALQAIQRYKIQTIYTHSPPHSTHLLGLFLKRLLPRLRWIADFEDAYSLSPQAKIEGRLRLALHGAYEKKIYRRADCILLATEAMRKASLSLASAQFVVLPNAFDEEDIFPVPPQKLPQYSLVHTGSFFAFRSPLPFLQLLQEYYQHDPKSLWHTFFIGRVEMGIPTSYLSIPSAKNIHFIPHQPKKTAIAYLKGADALLVIHGRRDEASLHLPAKIFEYAAAGCPILAFTYPGPLADFVQKYQLGTVLTPNQQGNLQKLCTFLKQVEEKSFSPLSATTLQSFSRQARTKKLSQIITQLSGNKRRTRK